jgi:hypothetical protein
MTAPGRRVSAGIVARMKRKRNAGFSVPGPRISRSLPSGAKPHFVLLHPINLPKDGLAKPFL